MDEGYIKFNCNWIKTDPVPGNMILEINNWRDTLYKLSLIGAYSNGIGYGNISIRLDKKTFLITGSATGLLNKLDENHYVLVNEYDFTLNRLVCKGPIKASSESLTHAAIYECSPETNAVIHIHNITLWENLINKVPTTSENVLYGTPDMADEIKKLFNKTKVAIEKTIVMGGHKEGILTFGKTLEEAGKILLGTL